MEINTWQAGAIIRDVVGLPAGAPILARRRIAWHIWVLAEIASETTPALTGEWSKAVNTGSSIFARILFALIDVLFAGLSVKTFQAFAHILWVEWDTGSTIPARVGSAWVSLLASVSCNMNTQFRIWDDESKNHWHSWGSLTPHIFGSFFLKDILKTHTVKPIFYNHLNTPHYAQFQDFDTRTYTNPCKSNRTYIQRHSLPRDIPPPMWAGFTEGWKHWPGGRFLEFKGQIWAQTKTHQYYSSYTFFIYST